jgi:transcriptional regulator with XRE-family HTH domain
MFSGRIKTLRKEKKKTQNDLATYLNVRRSTYGEYERGIIMPPYDKIKAIADYFEVSVDYLMGNTDSKEFKSESIDVSETLSAMVEELEDENSTININGHKLNKASRELLILSLENAIKLVDVMMKKGH